MTQNSYELVFYGALVEGFSQASTKQHVAQLFKTSIEQVERMFTGKRVVIRNKLDQDTALKYIVAMQKRGAECQIEAMGAPGVKVDFTQAPVTSSPIEAASNSAPVSTASSEPSPDFTPKEPVSTTPAPVAQTEVASKSGLNVAGDKVDEILSSSHFVLDPTGVRLGDERPDVHIDLPGLDAISVAPAGSDLVDKKEELPVSVPDTSHLSLAP